MAGAFWSGYLPPTKFITASPKPIRQSATPDVLPPKKRTMKAIGTGWSRGVTWHDVEVRRFPGGRPTVAFHGKAAEFFQKLGAVRAHLSITHTERQAMAQVILESDEVVKA